MAPIKPHTFTSRQLCSPRLMQLIHFNQRLFYWPARLTLLAFPHHTRVLLRSSDLKPGTRYVIAANHQSMADPFIICSALPVVQFRQLAPFRYFAHNGLFDRVLRPFLLSFGAFPASRNRRYLHGLEAAKLFLAHSQTVVIFPEGRRIPHAIRPRSGVEVLAKLHHIEIIPAHLEWSKRRHRRRSYRLTIGQPLTEKNLSAQQILNRIYKLPLP